MYFTPKLCHYLDAAARLDPCGLEVTERLNQGGKPAGGDAGGLNRWIKAQFRQQARKAIGFRSRNNP